MNSAVREITLRFLAEPGDVNFGGKVHGGAVMKWIDQAGYACAVSWSGHYCVTVYVGGIRFLNPILIGHLVEVTARVIHTGRTSMHIALQVRAGDPRGGGMTETTSCTMVFVAVSSTGGSVPVHPWVPVTAEDKALQVHALKQMELRQAMESALAAKL
ncbi:MAG: acyl-CoA thioesterase [Verrucomicrobia bacterium]|nr:acyl-CoA thioesterase [Verrucomicrobiota bacterium]